MQTLQKNERAIEISTLLLFYLSLGLSSVVAPALREHINMIVPGFVALHIVSLTSAVYVRKIGLDWKNLGVLGLSILIYSGYVTLTSLIQTPDITDTRGWALFLSPYTMLMFVWIYPQVLSTASYNRILFALMTTVSCLSFVCLLIYFTDTTHIGSLRLAFVGFTGENFYRYCIFINRNYSAHFVLWVPSVALIFLSDTKNTYAKIFLVAAILVTTTHVLVSFSRGAQLMLAIALLPYFAHVVKNRLRWLALLVMAFFAVTALLISTSPFAQKKYFSEMLFQSHRLKYWTYGIEDALTSGRWLFGAGLFNANPLGDNPHASYLAIFLYYGIVGLLIFTTILALLFYIFWKYRSSLRSLEAQLFMSSVAAILVGGFFEDYLAYPFYFLQLYLWFIIGFLLSNVFRPGLNSSLQIEHRSSPSRF